MRLRKFFFALPLSLSLSHFPYAERKATTVIIIVYFSFFSIFYLSLILCPSAFRFLLHTLYSIYGCTIEWQDIRRFLATNDFRCTQMSRPTPSPPTRTQHLYFLIVASFFRRLNGIQIQYM